MDQFKMEKELRKLQELPPSSIPHIVRVRVEEAYREIAATPVTRKKWRLSQAALKKIILGITAAAVIGVAIVGSGFVSPAMAQTLRQISLVNSVFKLAGDLGLQAADEQGLSHAVNYSDTHNGVTLSVSEVFFDGTRLSLALNRQASDDPNGIVHAPTAEAIRSFFESIKFRVGGQTLHLGHSLKLVENGPIQSAILEITDDSHKGGYVFPDSFDLTVVARLKDIRQPFELSIPVTHTGESLILTPDLSQTYDSITMNVDKVILTPATTQVIIQFKGNLDQLGEKLKGSPDFFFLEYALFDDQGNEVASLGSSSTFNHVTNSGSSEYRYEPLSTVQDSITLKPYFINNAGKKEFLKDFEFTFPVEREAMEIHLP